MISKQVEDLREMAVVGEYFDDDVRDLLVEAADTIESISAKLQAANMEVERLREVTRCDGEWIYCADRDNFPNESGEYRTISNCQEVFAKLNFDASDNTWYNDYGQYRDVIAWWKVYPYEP